MQLKDKKDIKLFILYIMYNLKSPIDYTTANDVCVQDEVITPFEFAECFSELLDTQTIAEFSQPDGEQMFYVTQRGEHVVTTLQDSLSSSLRERCLRNAMSFLSFKQRGTKIECNVTPREDGKFLLECVMTEKDGILLEVKIAVPTKQQADRMAFHFSDNPEAVYRSLIYSMKASSLLNE